MKAVHLNGTLKGLHLGYNRETFKCLAVESKPDGNDSKQDSVTLSLFIKYIPKSFFKGEIIMKTATYKYTQKLHYFPKHPRWMGPGTLTFQALSCT